mmetsp:Transcript_30359/g.46466  ORF Transcript_30359/g.46466 Transcript_30359/m.46466 type:complete len:90 (-) Transcript_30359:2622-2891(-)
MELVAITRKGNLSEKDSLTLGCLIIFWVHAKDVTAEIAEQRVRSLADFDWLSQLRHYYLPPKGARDTRVEIDIKMIAATRGYGFEYLGN